jgi:LPS-assembly lipoprotein
MRLTLPLILLLSGMALLQACGWQLRQAPEMDNLPDLTISGASNTLRHELTEHLAGAGVRVGPDSPWTLIFTEEDWTRRTVATDARGRAAERELRLNLAWQLRPANKELAPTPVSQLTLTRTFRYSPSDATTTSDEQDLLRDSIYQDAVWQILRQLEATAPQLPQARDAAQE